MKPQLSATVSNQIRNQAFYCLTTGQISVILYNDNTPSSFGERAQSRSERSGSCYFWAGLRP